VEWLGGSDLVRDLVRADVLEVMIDDIGFGMSEAVFKLAGAKAAAQRIEEACEPGTSAPATSASPLAEAVSPAMRSRATGAPRPEQRHRAGSPEQGRAAPPPSSILEREPPLSGEPPPHPGNEPTPAVTPEARQAERRETAAPDTPGAPPNAPVGPSEPAPPAQAAQGAAGQDRLQSGGEIHAAAPVEPREPAAATPLPRPAEPASSSAANQAARLAAYFEEYGPNRKGELIYDWYHRCLQHAGIDPEHVWYLSNEELTYLSRGETDRVRLSMLISADRNLDAPPRQVTCQGTARGRDLTIDRAE
jgi:hypothetical protein